MDSAGTYRMPSRYVDDEKTFLSVAAEKVGGSVEYQYTFLMALLFTKVLLISFMVPNEIDSKSFSP